MKFQFAAILTLCLAFLPAGQAQDAKVEHYTIDTVHSSIHFKTRHAGVSYTYGRFNAFSGSYTVRDGRVVGESVKISIDVASIDTGNDKRDDHLRSPDFFGVEKMPQITFQGTGAKTDGDKVVVTGKLTLMGMTQEVSIPFTKTGEGPNHKGVFLQGYEGSFTLNRADYGMTYGVKKPVDGEVTVIVALESARDK